MKKLAAFLLLSAVCANAGVVRFTAKHVVKPVAKTSAKVAVKTVKVTKKVVW